VSTITPEISTTQRLAGRSWVIYAVAALIPVLLLVVIWAAALYVIHLERVATEQAAIHSSQEILETYDAQMVRNLGAIDQTLKIVKFSFELEGSKFSLPDLREKGVLPSSVVFDVRIANGRGDILADAPKDLPTNVAREPYFQVHAQSDSGVPYVGNASKNAATGSWELQFSRRLNAADGSFAGVVILSVDPAYFTSGYEHSRLGEHGMVGLLGADGEFRVIRSGDDVSSGQKVDYNIATHDKDGSYAAGVLMQSPWDKRWRYIAARALHGYPLTAIAGLSRDEQFAAYEQHRNNYLWEATGASALLLFIGAVLGTLSWQLTESRREFRKIQQTYYAASEGSVDAFYVLQAVFHPDGSISDFLIRDANIRGAELLGTHKQGVIGKKLREVFPPPEFERIFADLASVALSGIIHETEWRNSSTVFRADWLYRQVVRVEDGVMAIVRDISERKRLETKIQFQATHDSLTGLANRNLLHDRLNQAIAQAQRSDSGVWIIFVDLDRFKVVNDSLGHKAGDSFLTTISERLQSAVRDADTVARLGGDEFVLILPEIDANSLNASSVQRIMQVISQPIQIEQKEFSLNCSIGVAIFPNDGDTAGQLIERADIAMYRAKETGRNNFQFFTAEMNERLLERLRIEEAMRSAIDRGEFVLYYQPQVDLRSGEIIGAEALLRWQHPEMGMVSPARFIGLAEETGMIVEIGQWAIRHACDQHMAWLNAGLGRLRMAVNLSARQFSQPDLVASISKVLDESKMAPQDLELELTEGMVMADVESAIATLRDLKSLNVQLAIDDFGTGYSSLSYLKRFPIDVLKIDRSFVNDIAHSADDATIVLTIISLAHNLRLRVIAEGVETVAQLAYLQEHDCDEMQGYYFSRPLPADEFAKLLAERKRLQLSPPSPAT